MISSALALKKGVRVIWNRARKNGAIESKCGIR